MLFASTLIPIFAGLITTFGVNTSFIRLLLYPGAFGFTSGTGFNAPISAVQTVLPKDDAPLGLSIVVLHNTLACSVRCHSPRYLYEWTLD